MSIRDSVLVIAVAVTAAGCGDKGPAMAPAGGIVLYNGDPLANANVVFVPEAGGPTSIGQPGADGRFTLSSSARPGAMVGQHLVSVQAFERYRRDGKAEPVPQNEIEEEGATKSAFASRPVIPPNYGNPDSSGLTAEVKASDENDFTFELTGPPRKP
jgi:hypothetical protein